MKEPIASVTNVFYFIAGVVGYNLAPGVSAASFLVGMTVLALGSFWYHSSLTKQAQAADEIGMYVAFGTLLAIGMTQMAGEDAPLFIPAILFAGAAMMYDGLDSFIAMPVLVAACIVSTAILAGFVIGAAVFFLFLVAVGVRQWGEYAEDRGSAAAYNVAHGLWHLLTAGGAVVMFAAMVR